VAERVIAASSGGADSGAIVAILSVNIVDNSPRS
jgi:hypothetical protein